MITDAQVLKLRRLLGEGHPLYRAALKVGMDTKSARKYRQADRLPSESIIPRTWRTREDPFQDVWPQLRDLLERFGVPKLDPAFIAPSRQSLTVTRKPDRIHRGLEAQCRNSRRFMDAPQLHSPVPAARREVLSVGRESATIYGCPVS